MEKLFYLSLMTGVLAVCCTITACSSDKNDSGSEVKEKRLVRWTETSGSSAYNYFVDYNSKGQIVQVKLVLSSGSASSVNYAYENNKITKSSGSSTFTFTLSNGRIVTGASSDFKYDEDGQLISVTSSDKNTAQYEWSDGNIVKKTYSYDSSSEYMSCRYTYSEYSSSMLPQFSSIGEWVLESQGFIGKRNRNLPSKVTTFDDDFFAYNNSSTSYDYTIEGGVVTKVIATSTNSSGVVSTSTIDFIWEEAK